MVVVAVGMLSKIDTNIRVDSLALAAVENWTSTFLTSYDIIHVVEWLASWTSMREVPGSIPAVRRRSIIVP